MRVFVVYRDYGHDDGYGPPLAAFSTQALADAYIARHKAKALAHNWVNFYEIEELTVDHPPD
jgi:hypothetical protein